MYAGGGTGPWDVVMMFRECGKDSPWIDSGGCCSLRDVITEAVAEGGGGKGWTEGGGREPLSNGEGLKQISWECKSNF